MTALRSIGYLSRNVHPYRSEPAGPQLPTPDAQALGPCHLSLAVMPHQGSWAAAEVAEATEAYLHPVVVARGAGPADGALPSVEGLSLLGAGVELVSLRRRTDADTAVEVRVVNMSDQPTVAVLGSDALPGPRGRPRRRARHGGQPARRGRWSGPGSAAPMGDRRSAHRHRSPPPPLTTAAHSPQDDRKSDPSGRTDRSSIVRGRACLVSRTGRGRPASRPRASTDRTTPARGHGHRAPGGATGPVP